MKKFLIAVVMMLNILMSSMVCFAVMGIQLQKEWDEVERVPAAWGATAFFICQLIAVCFVVFGIINAFLATNYSLKMEFDAKNDQSKMEVIKEKKERAMKICIKMIWCAFVIFIIGSLLNVMGGPKPLLIS